MFGRFVEFIANKMLMRMLMAVIAPFLEYTPRMEMMERAMTYVRATRLDGDYLEFGVWKGNTFVSAYYFARQRKCDGMRFYAFDSFEGLPESEVREGNPGLYCKGQYACEVSDFIKCARKKGVDLGRVDIVRGWFDKTLCQATKDNLGIGQAAVIWVDCDLYESTVPVLNFITDYLVNGTLLVFDDWYVFKADPDEGEQRAVREWLARNKDIELVEYHKYGWHGISFIVRRR